MLRDHRCDHSYEQRGEHLFKVPIVKYITKTD